MIQMKRLVVSGHQLFIIPLSNLLLVRAHFFAYLRAMFLLFVLHQQSIMVIASSSKTTLSTRPTFKTGPPAKKAAAISIAKDKKTKQQSIKKYVRKGKLLLLLLRVNTF
jgi:hypothetical protein